MALRDVFTRLHPIVVLVRSAWVLRHELVDVEEALQVAERVVGFPLADLTLELALAGAIRAPLVH